MYWSATRSYKYRTQRARNICEARQIEYEIQAQIQYALLLIATKIWLFYFFFVTKLQNQNLSIGGLYQNSMQKVETVKTGSFV